MRGSLTAPPKKTNPHSINRYTSVPRIETHLAEFATDDTHQHTPSSPPRASTLRGEIRRDVLGILLQDGVHLTGSARLPKKLFLGIDLVENPTGLPALVDQFFVRVRRQKEDYAVGHDTAYIEDCSAKLVQDSASRSRVEGGGFENKDLGVKFED